MCAAAGRTIEREASRQRRHLDGMAGHARARDDRDVGAARSPRQGARGASLSRRRARRQRHRRAGARTYACGAGVLRIRRACFSRRTERSPFAIRSTGSCCCPFSSRASWRRSCSIARRSARWRRSDARDEIERLSILGAETLNAGVATDALDAIAEVIRSTLGVDRCEILAHHSSSGGGDACGAA